MRHETFEIDGFVSRDTMRAGIRRYARLKRALDVGLCLCAAPVIAPLVGFLWLIVRRDGAPGFFGQNRVGRAGAEFTCWKLRTMVPDAEDVLRAHLRGDRAAAREWAHKYKLTHDPRITRFGRFLRRTSLDELPQLWNVWRGEMSIVGPRPVPVGELAEYGPAVRAYFALRPGITGLWQVSGRNEVDYATRIRIDIDYARRIGLLLDISIILRTLGVIVRRTGL